MKVRRSSTQQGSAAVFKWLALLLIFLPVCATGDPCRAQEETPQAGNTSEAEPPSGDGTATIILHAPTKIPDPALFFSARANATVQVGASAIEQTIELSLQVVQGKAKSLSLGLIGDGSVTEVQEPNLKSWSIRQQGSLRFLELGFQEDVVELKPVIKIRSEDLRLPTEVELLHLAPGEAVGFESRIAIHYDAGIDGVVTVAEGFVPIEGDNRSSKFQTSTGGRIVLSLNRDGATPEPIELRETSLTGTMAADGKSIRFQLLGTAEVTEAGAAIAILAGGAAVSQVPDNDNYRLKLSIQNESPTYQLVFSDVGTFPVSLDFVAGVTTPESNWKSVDFTIAAGAVVPIKLTGLGAELDFQRDQASVVPLRDDQAWLGFLPATGRAKLQWKVSRQAGEGKLFFTAASVIDAKMGAGLLRQDHEIDYQVLQGELTSLSLRLSGPGEILDVQGSNVIAWQVTEKGEERQLDATLSQPITGASKLSVRSQTPVGAFPTRVEGLRLSPIGAIRHSGHLRLTNSGSVRLEPNALSGLTQLSPEQFPREAIEARQVFVYRFPAAEYAFTIAADRIQPEVNVSEVVLYQLGETDRVIQADVELDIREAPIRDFDFGIPADYSVVAVTGASVADYIVASEVTSGVRNLTVIFGQDVDGRQLVNLHLEKNEAATAQDWVLPRIEYPDAKSVRGNVGVIGSPGFRVAVAETELLAETPLSYFPKPTVNLQQAFRIRESGWSATMQVELIERSVQADVFHLYSLSQQTVYGSALINYFVTGAPVSELRITVPEELANVLVDGQDIRTWRREDDTLIVSLHQSVMGPYTLLVTFEEKPDPAEGAFQAGRITPLGVQGERGYVQVVSPMQVEVNTQSISEDMLRLDPLELPAEFRLLSTAPPLGTWQYTVRPFNLALTVKWFEPGTTVAQVVEFSEAKSRVSQDGELVTDVLYYVKTRGQGALRVKLPSEPVRLWEVTVQGEPVTARQTEDVTLIPLPGGTDPNVPVEVRLRLGKPAVDASYPVLTLPIVAAPVLKTQWNVRADENCVLVPSGGTVTPPLPVLRPTGFDWVANQGMVALILIGLLVGFGTWACGQPTAILRGVGVFSLFLAIVIAFSTAAAALTQMQAPAPLQLSLPILAAGETVELQVHNLSRWRVNLSSFGLLVLLAGITTIVTSFVKKAAGSKPLVRVMGVLLVAAGVLMQRDGAAWFYGLLGLTILVLIFAPRALENLVQIRKWFRQQAGKRQGKRDIQSGSPESKSTESNAPRSGPGSGAVTATMLLIALFLSSIASPARAEVAGGFEAADSITQQWTVTHADARLSASGSITISGKPGDRFLLLRAPAVLTRFEGEGLRLVKRDLPGQGLAYLVSIPVSDETTVPADSEGSPASEREYQATFEFHLESLAPNDGVPVLTGAASVQEIQLSYDQAGWEISGPTVIRVEPIEAPEGTTQAKILLGPGNASLIFKPKARDFSSEPTQFFVEAFNLYLPGPGVVDGRHRLHIRTSQGQVSELNVMVPKGLTVSEVGGPIGSWQFDADSGRLELEVEPPQSQAFDVMIDTQRGLEALPADVSLAPLRVADANGEVGLVAIAFGPDAQPEKLEPTEMSAVNLGDFDSSLIGERQAALHRVYRYGAEGGEVAVRVAPVLSEVRVLSKQVLSFGDERVVLSVNFVAEISRSGIFQLSFPLPEGIEVESLTGDSLHHWAELREGDQRQIILHLNGKTIGSQSFALVLSGPTPSGVTEWAIPRFALNEANRQTGELVVRPTTGIRLRTLSRQNVSETDPRTLGGAAPGALAFRLLQGDWSLVLGVEKLDPWVTGQVLHEVTLREGQTRTALIGNFHVQNASIRTLQVRLPITDDDEIKTLRATGDSVSDLVRIDPDSDLWELQFKRRIIGNARFQIEYERRGDRVNESETISPAEFPQSRLLDYLLGVRTAGRLEIQYEGATPGWQRADWQAVPQVLREAGVRNAPSLVLRSIAPAAELIIQVKRHSLADALKLRVAKGELMTVLSPTGDQLTSIDVTMEVMQRSSLTVALPSGGELFSVFVNGESVHSIRQGDNTNAWQFYVLPGIDDRTANVRFVYSVKGQQLRRLKLVSPELNVPLENIAWHVIAPRGFELVDHDGNLELIGQASQGQYDRESYLSKSQSKRQLQAQRAAQLLEQANQLLQAGEQTKARWALNSVANQYALDAASNEDARVQLENLQTQQAVVGLNTRRQRLYLDHDREDAAVLENQQLRQAAEDNPILQQEQLNFRPQQLSQLLRGNTSEDNAILQRIAGRLVQHQHTTEPAPQAIIISLPEEGLVYTFRRSVQVAENAPLELDLRFASEFRLHFWQVLLASLFLVMLAIIVARVTNKSTSDQEKELAAAVGSADSK